MTPILYLIGLSLVLGGGGLALFLWASRSGQYDDMDGAASRILFDDEPQRAPRGSSAPPALDSAAGSRAESRERR